ncbi:Phage Gp37Gp68 family protein [Acidithiobacillus ferrivorans]|uniref:Phage Gp37Gp68 family protein n=1 Tax=Acidithiobacillus ferrivorans TaxID=160808 RepID=A0A060UQN9_9PROT|nr:phage Gp37/Gp68 family protein [Acidithiobacillus ferrivorans]CDQ10581.1 Phage Gp37Gp68 family protein [Acidithiobacillus ferrivorans]SMH64612.1 Phage Gp37Gp68 family protein [Acidithiobacillus ferrivorans]
MSDKTGIAWTDASWNPVTGCTKVSQGCKHCYAEREWARLSANPKATTYYGRAFTDVACHEDRLDQPLRWSKPRMIFVNSMSDLFHEDVPDAFIDKVFAVMALAEKHVFQVLTKRPERMFAYLTTKNREDIIGEKAMPTVSKDDFGILEWPLPNVWLGVSVEDQAAADARIPLLLQTPAAVRWVSAEPLLERVELSFAMAWKRTGPAWKQTLDWVVCGGESGPKSRVMEAEWVRAMRDQCVAANVPFFMKQLGAAFVGPDDGFGLFGTTAPYTSAKTYAFGRLKDRAGANMDEWPEDLRVREWPRLADK